MTPETYHLVTGIALGLSVVPLWRRLVVWAEKLRSEVDGRRIDRECARFERRYRKP